MASVEARNESTLLQCRCEDSKLTGSAVRLRVLLVERFMSQSFSGSRLAASCALKRNSGRNLRLLGPPVPGRCYLSHATLFR